MGRVGKPGVMPVPVGAAPAGPADMKVARAGKLADQGMLVDPGKTPAPPPGQAKPVLLDSSAKVQGALEEWKKAVDSMVEEAGDEAARHVERMAGSSERDRKKEGRALEELGRKLCKDVQGQTHYLADKAGVFKEARKECFDSWLPRELGGCRTADAVRMTLEKFRKEAGVKVYGGD